MNSTGHVLTAGEARAYDAPFPSEAHCAGARAFPPLNVLRADDPGAGHYLQEHVPDALVTLVNDMHAATTA